MEKSTKNIRKVLQAKFSPKFDSIKNILSGINTKSKKDPNTTFNELYPLLFSVPLLVQALGNIRSNKGMSSPGTSNETLDEMSMNKIIKIAHHIKLGTFKFSPLRRIYIPKSGKKKLRPLSIPNLTDRIVQEALRIILESIYEPVFQSLPYPNYGFRPNKSCHNAISSIKHTGTGNYYAIEGDITGAYDNVDISLLIKILRERIRDEKFLSFIKQSCETGYIHMGIFEDSLIGVPQGGIASPILFNIYMHKFDHYINYKLNNTINRYNKLKGRNPTPKRNPEYHNINSKIRYHSNEIEKLFKKGTYNTLTKKNQQNISDKLKIKRKLAKLRLKIPSQLPYLSPIRITYYRYADDWILLTNGNKEFAMTLKNHIAKWLKIHLKFELSSKKTKITNLKAEPARFLGFTIKIANSPRIKINTKTKNPIRTATVSISIGIDLERVLGRLYLRGFCNPKFKPIAKNPYSVLPIAEIIKKYSYIIRGTANYFLPMIDHRNTYSRIHYILKYSCYGTIAKKLNSSIYKIMTKFGKPPTFTITMTIKDKKTNQTKNLSQKLNLISYRQSMILTKKLRDLVQHGSFPQITSDIFSPMRQVNWRTYKNLNAYCLICGTDQNVE